VIEGQTDHMDSLLKACEGVDTVIHLAGQPSANARWDSLLKDNIQGYFIDIRTSLKKY
jgi:nucleoside-diphosphate-sugar epimerase